MITAPTVFKVTCNGQLIELHPICAQSQGHVCGFTGSNMQTVIDHEPDELLRHSGMYMCLHIFLKIIDIGIFYALKVCTIIRNLI